MNVNMTPISTVHIQKAPPLAVARLIVVLGLALYVTCFATVRGCEIIGWHVAVSVPDTEQPGETASSTRMTVWDRLPYAKNSQALPVNSQTDSKSVAEIGNSAGQELTGVWEAEQVFAANSGISLTIRQDDGEWTASVDNTKARIASDGKDIRVLDADEEILFRGHYDQATRRLEGHWIQPVTANLNYPLATPVSFTRTGDTWHADVRPMTDRLRLYLSIARAHGFPDVQPMEAFIRNPERNVGLRLGYLLVATPEDRIRLSQMRGDNVFDVQRSNDQGIDTLIVELPFSDQAFEFRRAKKNSGSGFYPSHLDSPYVYSVPESIDDGWGCVSAVQQGFDVDLLKSLVQSIRDSKTDALEEPYIHSLLIARNGKLVLEEYFYGNERSLPHDTRSAGKSIASMLVGAVLDKNNQLDENTTLQSIFGDRFQEPAIERQDGARQQRVKWRNQITIGHALAMQSGLDADDDNYESPGSEDRMQDQTGNRDWVDFGLGIPMCRKPGLKSVYGSNNINLAANAIAEATGEWLPDLFAEHVATPLGIVNYHFNLDPAGNGYMGGGIRLTARDQLKLGQVMLDGGKWNGNQVIGEAWVQKSIQARGSIHEPDDYGYGWWNKSLPVGNRQVSVFYAGGNGGQLIVCIPELDMVVQMSGGNYGHFPVWYRNLTDLIPQKVLTAVKQEK